MSWNQSHESYDTIRILVIECETLLQSIIDSGTSLAAKGFFEDSLQRLSTWAAYLGVFARPRQCLTHRLQNATDIRDLALRSLDSIGRASMSISQNSYLLALSIDESQDALNHNEEDLLEIEDALEQLYRLASVIKRSSRKATGPRAREFAGPVPVDELFARTIECLYPQIDQSLQEVLYASMSDRFTKITTLGTRQTTLPARHVEQVSLPTISEEDQRAAVPSSESQVQQPRRCEWCSEPLNSKNMDSAYWRQHVDHDLRPYICLAEHCTITVGYPSIREWSSHMQQHNEFWYRTVYLTATYVCPLCVGVMSPFANRGELLQHLTKEHQSDTLDYDQLSMIAGQSQGIKERPNDECLLCGFVIETECEKDVPSQRQSESRREGNTKKRKTERDQFNPIEVFSSSEDEEDQSHKANNYESMTRHIATHLQSLMFLTLRVVAMQKDMGSDDEDVTGSNVGTVDIRDYQDSQHLDYSLSFEDESPQLELAWLPAVEAYSFNFDRQQHKALRYPVLEREDIINTSVEPPDSSTVQETIIHLEALLATTEQNLGFYNFSIGALESARHRNSLRPSYHGGGNSGSVSLWQCCNCGCGWQHVAWSPNCPDCGIPRCKQCLHH